MEIGIILDAGSEGCPDAEWLRVIAGAVLEAESAGKDIEMGLVITGQHKIRELNKTYRGIDRPTDVLSFPMQEGEDTDFTSPPDGIVYLGDVVISYPQAQQQAKERRHSVKKEMAVLTIHGILHLLGYDHTDDGEAQRMETRERQILQDIEGDIG